MFDLQYVDSDIHSQIVERVSHLITELCRK